MTAPVPPLLTAPQWAAAKEILRHTLTQGTYDRFIANAALQAANGKIRISVSTPQKREWLEHRLKTPILRALNTLIDPGIEPDKLVFVVEPDPALPTEPSIPPAPGFPDFYAVWKKTGYSQVAHYVTRFWIPYLNPTVFAVWKAIETTDTRPVSDFANRWTRPREYTFRQLARSVGLASRHPISGAKRECGVSLNARLRGYAIQNTCAPCPHTVHRLEPDPEQVNRCKFWRAGALEILYREKLLALEVTQSTPAENSRFFRFSVYRVLPLLAPAQVASLPKPLRREHLRWLHTHRQTLGVTPDAWQQLTANTLVPAQAGYERYKPLDGHYEFNRLLVDIQENTKVVS